MDDVVGENGSELARLLQGREGWRLEVQDGVFFGVSALTARAA